MNSDQKKTEKEIEQKQDEKMEEYGQMTLEDNKKNQKIHLLSIIGEVEGHENAPGNSKTTKYDHVLPQLAALEDNHEVKGMLVLLNTSGGDVDAGLAIAEMIASLSMPTVSLVLGGSHSSSAGSMYGLLIYCSYRDYDGSSGSYDWYGHWSYPNL